MNKNLIINILFFILSVVFILELNPLFGRSAFHIFKIEISLIILYSLINKDFPSKILTINPLLTTLIFGWFFIFLTANAISIYKDGLGESGEYFYIAFHSVFLIYVVALVQKIRLHEQAGFEALFANKQVQDRTLLIFLCVLTFSIALTSGGSSFSNADIVTRHELIFIIAYAFIYKSTPSFSHYLKQNTLTVYLFILWGIAVTASFLLSPYDLVSLQQSIARYYQTFFHAAFFIFTYHFLKNMSINSNKILLMLPLSVVIMILIMLISWTKVGDSPNWFNAPPLADHIRHIGYIVTASTSIMFVYILFSKNSTKVMIFYIFLLLSSATLLFWTGGRAATLSILSVFLLLIAYSLYIKNLKLNRLLILCATIILAVYISEAFKVFDWNSIANMFYRTDKAENFNSLTSGRLVLWVNSIASLKGHWLLGLGPQGFYYMPNHTYGVQPHNMFIQFIVEWGLLGSLFFMTLLIRAGITILIHLKNNAVSLYFLSAVAVLVSLTIHAMVDGTYYHGQPSYYIALAFAICFSVIFVNKKEST